MRRDIIPSQGRDGGPGLFVLLGLVTFGLALQIVMMPRDGRGASPALASARVSRAGLFMTPPGPASAPSRSASPRPAPAAARAADAAPVPVARVAEPAEAPADREVKPVERATIHAEAGSQLAAALPPEAAVPGRHPVAPADEWGGQAPADPAPAGRGGGFVVGADAPAAARQADPEAPPVGGPVEAPAHPGITRPTVDSRGVIAPDAPLDPESEGTHLLVLGPSQVRERELVTYLISVENASDLAHAPLRLSFNPEVLEFQSSGEGALLSTGGAATQFLAGPSANPGLVDIAISRVSPRTGVQGSGTLCSVTFLAKTTGESPILTSGSRLLDSSAHSMEFRRDDTHVAVR